jgi:hypothetical protein
MKNMSTSLQRLIFLDFLVGKNKPYGYRIVYKTW